MARPALYDEALRERLLSATIDAIDREGPARVSLRDVARAADTSTSAVYALFGGKPGLLLAAVTASFTSFAASQQEAEPRGFRALGVAYRAWALQNPARYRLMFGGGLSAMDLSEEDRCAQEATITPLARTIAARVADPARVQRLTAAVWAQVHGVVSLELTGMPATGSWEEVYEDVLDAVERMVAAA